MPQIDLTGSSPERPASPSDPKQSKGAAWDAYAKAQKDEGRKASQVDAAYTQIEQKHASDMEALWRAEVAQKKAQLAAENQLFKAEMAQRKAALDADRQRNAERKRLEGIHKQAENAETKRYNAMRKEANEENADLNRKHKFAQRQEADRRRAAGAAPGADWTQRGLKHLANGNYRKGFGHLATGRLARGLGSFGGGEAGAGAGVALAAVGGPAGVAAMVAYAAYEGAKKLVNAPGTINNYVQGMMGPAQPWMDFRRTLGGIGRTSGVSSKALQEAFLPSNGKPVDWEQRYGIGPATAANILSAYGIAPENVTQGVGVTKSIARSAYQMNVDPMMLARSAREASSLGVTNQMDVDQWLKKLGNVQAMAVTQGVDKAQAIANMNSLLERATTGNTASLGSGKALYDTYMKSMQAGTPGARNGTDAQDLVGASHQLSKDMTFQSTNTGALTVTADYITRHGGPQAFAKDDKALTALIGQDAYDKMLTTPGGRESLDQFHKAAKAGNTGLMMQTLSPLVDGNSTALLNEINGSYLKFLPDGYRRAAISNTFGLSPQEVNNLYATGQLGPPGKGRTEGKTPGSAAMGSETRAVYDEAIKQGLSPNVAADMASNAYYESTSNPKSVNASGHAGLFQWDSDRQKRFKAMYHEKVVDAPVKDQVAYAAWEMNQREYQKSKTKDNITGFSPFSHYFEKSGDDDADFTRGRFKDQLLSAWGQDSSNTKTNTTTANAETQALNASKVQAGRIEAMDGGSLGNTFTLISTTGTRLNDVLNNVITRVTEFGGVLDRVNKGASSLLPLAHHTSYQPGNPYQQQSLRKA